MSRPPPFQTATLARLYLSQGHHDTAEAIAHTLPEDEVAELKVELARANEVRVSTLEALLERIQARRYGPDRTND